MVTTSMMRGHHRNASKTRDDTDDQRSAPTERRPNDGRKSEDGQHGDDAAGREREQGDEAEPFVSIQFRRGAHDFLPFLFGWMIPHRGKGYPWVRVYATTGHALIEAVPVAAVENSLLGPVRIGLDDYVLSGTVHVVLTGQSDEPPSWAGDRRR